MVTRDATTKVQTYAVSEVYGPVCQGEGALIGKPTIFVRLGGCDYRCAWCDSLYAVLPQFRKEWAKTTAAAITEHVAALLPAGHTFGHVTLSGGNPAIHPCRDLIAALHTRGYRVAIETQGSICPDWLLLIDDVTLSPKPPSSGNVTPYDPESALMACLALADAAVLKVVVFDDADYDYARAVHLTYPGVPFYLQVGTAVGVATRGDLCDALNTWQTVALSDAAMQDVAILPQLHAILKGHARGI